MDGVANRHRPPHRRDDGARSRHYYRPRLSHRARWASASASSPVLRARASALRAPAALISRSRRASASASSALLRWASASASGSSLPLRCDAPVSPCLTNISLWVPYTPVTVCYPPSRGLMRVSYCARWLAVVGGGWQWWWLFVFRRLVGFQRQRRIGRARGRICRAPRR